MNETIGGCHIEADFSGLERMLAQLGKGHFVDVGILGENGSKTEEGGATVAMVGAVQEFGSLVKKIPKRSFIAMPLQTHQEDIQKAVEPRFAGHLERGDVHGIFVDIGIGAEGVIQDAFDTRGFGTWAPNAESTIAQKGSDSPLIDTGTLRKSITSEAGVKG